MRFENRQEENSRERGDIRPDLRRSRTVRNHRVWLRFWWHDQKLARRKLRRENLLHRRSPDGKIRQLLVRHDPLTLRRPATLQRNKHELHANEFNPNLRKRFEKMERGWCSSQRRSVHPNRLRFRRLGRSEHVGRRLRFVRERSQETNKRQTSREKN